MDLPPFELERWFDRYEPDADIMLAESGIRPLSIDRFDLDRADLDELGYVIPTDGDPELRAKIGDRYNRGVEDVVLTCGTQEANYLTCQAVMDGDSHAVVVTPTYQSLQSVPEAIGSVTTVETEPPNWDLHVDDIAARIRPDTDLIVLANPTNPTGRYYDRDVIEGLYDLVVDADAELLVDEVYRLLAPDPDPPAASLGPRAISTAGVSKSYGIAGARLGWTVARESVADAVRRHKDYTTIAPPAVGQELARQALLEQESEILAANREHARRNRDRVADFLGEYDLSWYEPTGVNGFVTVPEEFTDGEVFCRTLVESESVVLAPGTVFHRPERFRIGFGLPTPELEAGLERVGRHIERRR